jgi:hypothetical protein
MSTVDNNMNISKEPPRDLRKDRLDSWKEIAVYLGRDVRTAQRWEKAEGLPVHRQFHVKAGTVCAFQREIDIWLNNRRRVVSESMPQERLSDQSVHWSSPMELVARSVGNCCWLWVVAPRVRFDLTATQLPKVCNA